MSGRDADGEFLALMATPFDSEIYSTSFLSSLILYGSCTITVIIVFSFIRPHYPTVYECKRQQYRNVAQPQMAKGPMGWVHSVLSAKEKETIEYIGLDAMEFLRFAAMLRDICTVLTVAIFAILIPINLRFATAESLDDISFFSRLTPELKNGSAAWAYVAVTYVVDIVVCIFLWVNCRAILQLKIAHLASGGLRDKPQTRTLFVTGVPMDYRSADGLRNLYKADGAYAQLETRTTVLSRPVESLKDGIDPTRSFGFVIFPTVEMAHMAALRFQNGGPLGTSAWLIAEEKDLILQNAKLTEVQRKRRRMINNGSAMLLTAGWVLPNAMIAVFLTNLTHLGLVWPAFQRNLYHHRNLWGVVQGTLPPALTSLMYASLPWILRRLRKSAGDLDKNTRDRGVRDLLFYFYLFNHMIVVSLFSTAWGYAAMVIDTGRQRNSELPRGVGVYRHLIAALISVSPYWCSYLIQRIFVAALDLLRPLQLLRLCLLRTQRYPRGTEPGAIANKPQPFNYASYSSVCLFYTSIALCFRTIQPLTLAMASLYFWLDYAVKKYMLLHISVTKHESYAISWPSLCDHLLLNVTLGNLVNILLVAAHGVSGHGPAMIGALVGGFVGIAAFRWYCCKHFYTSIRYAGANPSNTREATKAMM